MKRVCVFCGSSLGANEVYGRAARELGGALVSRGIDLVYGGGRIGLMGILADSVLTKGGQAFGVIPASLATKELAHSGLTRLDIVTSMHERKAGMARLADAFVGLPGGLGTFEELFEVITWAQLGLHRKPVGLLNAARYFDPLVFMVDRAIEEGFVHPEHRRLIVVEEDPNELLERLEHHRLPSLPKTIRTAES